MYHYLDLVFLADLTQVSSSQNYSAFDESSGLFPERNWIFLIFIALYLVAALIYKDEIFR